MFKFEMTIDDDAHFGPALKLLADKYGAVLVSYAFGEAQEAKEAPVNPAHRMERSTAARIAIQKRNGKTPVTTRIMELLETTNRQSISTVELIEALKEDVRAKAIFNACVALASNGRLNRIAHGVYALPPANINNAA